MNARFHGATVKIGLIKGQLAVDIGVPLVF